jgi:transcriptional regulator with XRE-family HTH domain
MDANSSFKFGDLLRRHRLAAGLTQEELAEHAQVSPRAISDLERGLRSRPWRDTIQLLADALKLGAAERSQLEASARQGAALPPGDARERPHLMQPSAVSPGQEGETTSVAVPDEARISIHRSNLPVQVTRFVGREKEVAEVRERLNSTRLITLTGTGGCGKTRLALEVAATELGQFRDGVWLVELAALTGLELVPSAVMAALGIREEPGQPVQATLLAALRPRQLLLVLDNCEHLVDACARLADAILHTCPHVRILATSREALGIGGEVSWRVPSLSVPAAETQSLGDLVASEAVHLFVDRAVAAQPAFTVTEQNAPAVAQICRRLDGIPLAIELAATRVRALSIEQIAARLDQRFRLLAGGSRAALPRQQTLAGSLGGATTCSARPSGPCSIASRCLLAASPWRRWRRFAGMPRRPAPSQSALKTCSAF